jgi:hypothetical protein
MRQCEATCCQSYPLAFHHMILYSRHVQRVDRVRWTTMKFVRFVAVAEIIVFPRIHTGFGSQLAFCLVITGCSCSWGKATGA